MKQTIGNASTSKTLNTIRCTTLLPPFFSSLALDKKFEDKELEALLEENQSQTQEKLAESLGITQQAVSV